jgi:hypothetical protein
MTPDAIAAALERIRRLEARPGYEGPMIARRLQLIRIMDKKDYGDDGEAVFGDRAVGAVVRVAKAHRNPQNHLDDWMIDIEDGGDSFAVLIKDRLGHKIGVGQGPLALAALLAWLAAIGGE